eukprot:scaffold5333_cov95-Skeletonema_dohrnii-CCMP3373.AAC.2
MASTHGGMRRILKKRLPVQKYIELAVKAGSYKSPSTRPNYLGLHDQRDNNNSFQTTREREESMKMRRGIIDYPTEHEILSLNPPLPIPPRTPVRIRKKLLADKRRRAEKLKKEQKRKGITDAEMREQQNSPPTLDKLVKGYLRRHEDKLRQGMSPSQSRKEEEYYSQLLLGQSAASAASGGNPATKSKFLSPSSLRTAMGRKSMLVENAYAFALRQQQIMLQEDKPATEQDSIEKVEQILREEARANRQGGRKATQEIEEWRTEETSDDAAGAGKKKDDDNESTLPSILHDRPRSIRALNIWSSRLQSIPYSRWTIGAATALDHWIAREVLQMDENTWQLVLAGGGTDAYVEGMETLPGGETKMGLMDRMRDIVTVRGALFPETLSDSGSSSGGRGSITGELDDELSETDKSIDELLASLGSSVDDDDSDLFKFDDEDDEISGDDDNDNDEQIESIMDELQVWRERNESSPYESWDNDRKSEFDQWLEKYVAALSPEAVGSNIDKNATRIALLSERPIDSNKSKEFWSKVRTESEAELFLEDYRKHAEEKLQALNDASSQTDEEKQSMSELQAILDVPFERQLQKILDMGTLRPVLDDYAPGSERNAFLEKYTPILLEGLVMEHLVPDADGPIGLDDLSSEIREELSQQWRPADGFGSDQEPRFAIQMIAYGTDEFATSRAERARDLYRLWNEHKASRARFEEAMFKKGYLPVEEDGTRGVQRKRGKKTLKK